MIIEGTTCAGLGLASKFLRMKEYTEKIKKVVGFEPYPGTLNVKVDAEIIKQIFKKAYKIERFEKNGKKFGGFAIIPCKIKVKNEILKAAIIFPEKSEHKDVLEIISPIFLREALKLKDGDNVLIELEI